MTATTPTVRFDPAEHAHRRRNLLTGDWVLVSPHRAKRPWQGAEANPSPRASAPWDAHCHLCPGNHRAGGGTNPDYRGCFVFPNDYPALSYDAPAPDDADEIFVASGARGEARVICFSPDHSRSLPELSDTERRAVVDVWCDQSLTLGRDWVHIEIFENKGEMMGCSSPHPHGQVWASDFVPTEVAKEDAVQRDWLDRRGRGLLEEVVEREDNSERVVEASPHWLAIVPWWASWPFEILLIARDPVARMEELGETARDDLAQMIGRVTARYDNLFGVRFPYSFGWHGAPHGHSETRHWRLHAHFYPPLLRSATVRKFMVGFEMLGEAQRDLTPEMAAARLRASSPVLEPIS